VDKKRVTHPAHSIFRYRSDHGYQSLTPQTCPRGIDREGNVMFCDEMWNGVSVFGCQSDIDRFKVLCIEEPDEQDEDQETYVTFDNILLIARAEDPKLAASLAKSAGFETWNFRAGKNELAGTYHFAFDTSPRFPYQVFKYLAKISRIYHSIADALPTTTTLWVMVGLIRPMEERISVTAILCQMIIGKIASVTAPTLSLIKTTKHLWLKFNAQRMRRV
jgi:hypothetical protein